MPQVVCRRAADFFVTRTDDRILESHPSEALDVRDRPDRSLRRRTRRGARLPGRDSAPASDEWLHELKFDGYRLIARIEKGKVTLLTRNGKDWTRRFPAIARALKQLPLSQAVLDGEAVIPEADGSTSFRKLQEYLSSNSRKNTARDRKSVV